MVRLKTRWLLVRIDYAVEIPTRNDLARAIRDNLLQCSGVAAAGAAYDTQGVLDVGCIVVLCVFFVSPCGPILQYGDGRIKTIDSITGCFLLTIVLALTHSPLVRSLYASRIDTNTARILCHGPRFFDSDDDPSNY